MDVVVVVHGYLMSGVECGLLRYRLRRQGFSCRQFHYRSFRQTADSAINKLTETLAAISAERVHIVGHSLGGVLIFEALARSPELARGRIVFLGSPIRGSAAARVLRQHRMTCFLMGGLSRELLARLASPCWEVDAELGLIAGTYGLGSGKFLAQLEMPHDGTVAVSETRVQDATDRIELNVTHTGLLFSGEVARQTGHFLMHGLFDHSSDASSASSVRR